ncbi:MAG: rod shape-determining protein RodA [Actinobacteria bacterium]|nr:MAG: rod shape-determining protein RodA [Actinomycetota bacterium]
MQAERILRRIDLPLIAAVLGLSVYGLVMIYSSGQGLSSSGENIFFKKQLISIVVGLLLMLLIAFSDYNWFSHYMPYIYGLNVFLLLLVDVLGRTTMGAQRWIPLGFFNLQPSEFGKIFVIVSLGTFLASRKGAIDNWRDVGLAFAHVGVLIVLVVTQPDLGTALILVVILLGMLLLAGMRLLYFVPILLVGLLLVAAVFTFPILHSYQMDRLVVFLNPDVDPSGAGYNLNQSKIAVGSGQLTGKGLFSGTQTNLHFLPARHTDFIFSVIGEELGFAGTSLLLGLYLVLLTRGLRIATTSRNLFGALLAGGIVTMWTFQVLVNVGMTIGIMPITGIPLPFISYGGSAAWTNLVAAGLLMSVYSRRLKWGSEATVRASGLGPGATVSKGRAG